MLRPLVFILFSTFSLGSQCWAKASFEQYTLSLFDEARQNGITDDIIQSAKASLSYRPTVVKADNNQPEKRITLSEYLSTRVPDWKVKQAVQVYQDHSALLSKISKEYGVQSRFIVALWGNESNFGRIQGSHPVLSSLASLAYEGRREALFKRQFFAALRIIQEGHIELADFVGSWAGAMGQSQFMPTNFLAYAVDYDGDGKKDIWHSTPDVLASIANFLKQHGWKKNYTWGRQVRIPEKLKSEWIGLGKHQGQALSHWHQLGVVKYNNTPLPKVNVQAWLIAPDGNKGRHYLVYHNFQTLMKWNRSSYFGLSVCYLSERINKELKTS